MTNRFFKKLTTDRLRAFFPVQRNINSNAKYISVYAMSVISLLFLLSNLQSLHDVQQCVVRSMLRGQDIRENN